MPCCKKKTCQTTLRLLSQLLWVMGILVGLVAYFLLKSYKRSSLFFSDTYITLPAFLAVACAVFLVLGGLMGCCLSKDSPCMQGTFVFLLVLVFCLISTSSALAYFQSTKLHSDLAPLSGVFRNYTGSSQDSISQAVDATQKELQCCGVHEYKDWLQSPWFNHTGGLSFPPSCCNSSFPSCNGTVDMPWQLYTQGCQVKLENVLQLVLRYMMWCLPVVFLVEVVLILTVAQLMRNQSAMEYQIMNKKY